MSIIPLPMSAFVCFPYNGPLMQVFFSLVLLYVKIHKRKRKKANREKFKCRQTVLEKCNLHFLMLVCVT